MNKIEQLTYTIPEMAKALKIGVNSAYNLVNSKGFPVISVGKKKVVPIEGLQKWLEKQSAM